MEPLGTFKLARFLFTRTLAFLYIAAFWSALQQFPALLGEHGLLPVPKFLAQVPFQVVQGFSLSPLVGTIREITAPSSVRFPYDDFEDVHKAISHSDVERINFPISLETGDRRVRQAYSRGRTMRLQGPGASARVRLTHPTVSAADQIGKLFFPTFLSVRAAPRER